MLYPCNFATETRKTTKLPLRLRASVALTILIIIQACSSSPEIEVPEDIAAMENVAVFSGMEEPQFDISLTEEARFGDTDTVFISSISGIAVDNNGNLFLADRSEATVHAYTPEGEYKFSVGRSGEGPGEFNAAYQPRMHNGELYVLDINQQRMSIFDPSDGTYLRAQPLGSGGPDTSGFPVRAEPLDEGRLLVFFNQMQGEGETYYNNRIPRILDEEGNVFRSGFIEFRPSEMHMIRNDNAIQMISLPFMGSSYADITPDDHIIWGFSDRLLLHEVNLEGEVIRSIYYSRESPPLDREGILANYEDEVLKDALRQIDFPENRQAFTAVTVDDEGRIWLTLPTVNEEENEVWVLAETGEKLAAFTRPATDQLELVKDGYVYFRVTEEETGIVEVVKYRFDL